jgi:hypothetical protein
MINKDTRNLTTEDATSYLHEEIPKNFQNVNLMPTTGNVIKNIMHSLKSTYLWL